MNQTKDTSNKDKRPPRLEGEQNILGNRMKKLREAKGLSFGKLAKILGKSKTTVIGYEHGYRFPLMRDIDQLAKELGTSVSYLIGETHIPYPSPLEQMIENGNFTYNGRELTEEELYRVLEHLQKKNQEAAENSIDDQKENNEEKA